MKKPAYFFSIIFFFLFLIGCVNSGYKITNTDIIGTWYFLESDSIYSEVYIDSSTIMTFSEKNLYMGPYEYAIQNDQIIFNGLKYNIKLTDHKSMTWSNSEFLITLSKIDSFIFNFEGTTDDMNPFFLRKCAYLVNNRIITMREAIEFLCQKNEIDNNEYIEEDLNIKRK